jgi:hypothetical protein
MNKLAKKLQEKVELQNKIMRTKNAAEVTAAATMEDILARFQQHLEPGTAAKLAARLKRKKLWTRQEWLAWRKCILEEAGIEVPSWLRKVRFEEDEEDEVGDQSKTSSRGESGNSRARRGPTRTSDIPEPGDVVPTPTLSDPTGQTTRPSSRRPRGETARKQT